MEFDGDVPSCVQLCVTCDKVKSQESWGDAYYEIYSSNEILNISGNKATFDFVKALAKLKELSSDDTAKLNQFSVRTPEAGTFTMVKATLTKNDTEEDFPIPTENSDAAVTIVVK
ncbi:MAG: hypothetical protein KIG91_01635 [Treponema sp.]|nr:hypothetical protein [Treponema sp.]